MHLEKVDRLRTSLIWDLVDSDTLEVVVLILPFLL